MNIDNCQNCMTISSSSTPTSYRSTSSSSSHPLCIAEAYQNELIESLERQREGSWEDQDRHIHQRRQRRRQSKLDQTNNSSGSSCNSSTSTSATNFDETDEEDWLQIGWSFLARHVLGRAADRIKGILNHFV